MADDDINSIAHIKDLLINTPDGRQVPLSDVADVVSTAGPNTISRENAQRKLVVSANATGRDMRSVVNDMQRAITQQVKLEMCIRDRYGGQFESEAAASRLLLGLSVVSIIVILLLLYLQFRSWAQAVVVLLNLPLALIGGVLALVFTGGVVSIPAIIGFISLFGMATRGGMLPVAPRTFTHRGGDKGLNRPFATHTHDGALLGIGPHSAGTWQHAAWQRNSKSHGSGHAWRTAHKHPAQPVYCAHHGPTQNA